MDREMIEELAAAADAFIAVSPMWDQLLKPNEFNRQARAYERLMRALNAARKAGVPLPAAPAQ